MFYSYSDFYDFAVEGGWLTEPSTDTQYDIDTAIDEDRLIIRFQGSVSVRDWFQNFMFAKRPYKQMENVFFVHRGFLKKYKSVREKVLTAVEHNLDRDVVIIGYSQGAALAVLAHEDIGYKFGRQPLTTVFGCPRVFGFVGKKTLDDRCFNILRIENGNDAVTKIPFRWMFYRHYGSRKHIGDSRKWWKMSFRDHLEYREKLREGLR